MRSCRLKRRQSGVVVKHLVMFEPLMYVSIMFLTFRAVKKLKTGAVPKQTVKVGSPLFINNVQQHQKLAAT